jgi:hypothetical protein
MGKNRGGKVENPTPSGKTDDGWGLMDSRVINSNNGQSATDTGQTH